MDIDITNEDLDMQSALEEMASETLLIELFTAKKAEVFEDVVFEGKRRYYIEDLTIRDYSLENTTPYQLDIMGNIIDEHSWGAMLSKVSNLLLNLFPDYNEKILSFQCKWSKQLMYSLEQKTNYKVVKEGLYINVNHTALHSCWFLQDLLEFFNIDLSKVHFLIHRPSSAEPQRVKDYIEQRFKKNFSYFICNVYKKPEEYSNKVISVFEKYLNPMLKTISKSYTNFFLFDDNATLYNYVKKVREKISSSMKFDDKAKKVLNKYLDYLVKYYKE